MIRSGQVEFYDALEPFMVPIDSIEMHPDNYNNGDVDEIRDSILTNGMFEVLKCQASSRYIGAGNHTWLACKELDARIIPATFLDMDNATTVRMMIAHNQTARKARPDPGLLLDLLGRITEANPERGLVGTGMTERDKENLEKIADIPISHPTANWPTISVTVPPHVRAAYYDLTQQAIGDRERFELLLRLAGWRET